MRAAICVYGDSPDEQLELYRMEFCDDEYYYSQWLKWKNLGAECRYGFDYVWKDKCIYLKNTEQVWAALKKDICLEKIFDTSFYAFINKGIWYDSSWIDCVDYGLSYNSYDINEHPNFESIYRFYKDRYKQNFYKTLAGLPENTMITTYSIHTYSIFTP